MPSDALMHCDTDTDLLSTAQTAALLGFSVDTLRRRLARNRGECPRAVRVGQSVVFRRSDVEHFQRFAALGA
jgi:predicted DNA-binding transcriptional regulator AlpA